MTKSYKNQLTILTSTFLLIFCHSVFAINFFSDDEAFIWKSGLNLYFKHAEQDSSKYGKSDHPADLNRKDLANALHTLEFTEKNFLSEATVRKVFSVSQINLLTKQIEKGLKNAKPEQDIVFVMAGGSRKLLILSKKNFVAGRVFFKDGKLNIIIGEYDKDRNDAFEKQYDPSGRAAIPYFFNHGKRSESSKRFDNDLIATAGVENRNFGKKSRKDWLIIDIKIAAKTRIAKLNTKNNYSRNQDVQSQIDAEKFAKERREMRAQMARMRKEMKEANLNSGSSSETAEARIVTLNELLGKKLITQREYDSKRQEILNDL